MRSTVAPPVSCILFALSCSFFGMSCESDVPFDPLPAGGAQGAGVAAGSGGASTPTAGATTTGGAGSGPGAAGAAGSGPPASGGAAGAGSGDAGGAGSGGIAGAGGSGGPNAGGSGAGAGGSASSSGGGGQSTQAGSGGLGGAGAGGMAGAAGSSGGQGGGAPALGSALNGAGWPMKCSKPDTSPGAGDRCWLLPPGQNACPQGGYTSVDRTLSFGGTPGVTYQVTLRFQGTHEAGDYRGGMADPRQFLRNGTHIDGGLHTWLSMEVSSPAAVYNPNTGAGGGSVQVYDYMATISIDGGATVRLKAHDSDCLMHRYCQNGNIEDCKGLVVPGISPADAPFDGGFMQMTVVSVVPK
jgi:hypothetical protein